MHNQNVLQHICTIFYVTIYFSIYLDTFTSYRKCTENCFVFHYSDSKLLWNEKTLKKNDDISFDVYCATPSRTKVVLKIDENWMSFRKIRTHEMEKKKKKTEDTGCRVSDRAFNFSKLSFTTFSLLEKLHGLLVNGN